MRRRIAHGLAVLFSIASLGAGAASGPNSSQSPPSLVSTPPASVRRAFPVNPKRLIRPFQVGLASWYGRNFHGRLTSSGEKYDMNDFTAAHPTLPLGSYVRVTNVHNGNSVIVRVNDRGPVIDGRIIDVSYSAARALGFQGLLRVRLDLVPSQALAVTRQ